jgi:hypothetical protein
MIMEGQSGWGGGCTLKSILKNLNATANCNQQNCPICSTMALEICSVPGEVVDVISCVTCRDEGLYYVY